MVNEVRTAVGNVLPSLGIDYTHWEAHKGKLFHFGMRNPALAAAATMQMVFTTSSKEVHFHPHIHTTGPAYQDLYEGAHCSSAGNVFKISNYNRNFTTSAGLTASYGAAASDGDVIWTSMIVGNTAGAAKGDVSVGGTNDSRAEFILKPNTTYRAQFVNASYTQMQVFFHCYFYEE